MKHAVPAAIVLGGALFALAGCGDEVTEPVPAIVRVTATSAEFDFELDRSGGGS